MSATATTSTWKSPSHSHSNSRSSRPSTTPRASHPSAASVGHSRPPRLSPHSRSSPGHKDVNSPSPSYFGYVVGDNTNPPDSAPGFHTKQNWNLPSDSPGPQHRHLTHERNQEFDLFRRESDKGFSFTLNNLSTPKIATPSTTPSLRHSEGSPASPGTRRPFSPGREQQEHGNEKHHFKQHENPFFAELAQNDSPMSMSPRHSVADHQHARLSLPMSELRGPLEALKKQRSETVPTGNAKESTNPSMGPPAEIAQLLEQNPNNVVLLDLRVYPQYAASRIRGALNLCIPTTLLKRPSFTVQKLADTFTSDHDKAKFSKWKDANYIIVYDATSILAKEAATCFNVLKKFASEGWKGQGLVVKGGFQGFQKAVPKLVDQGPINSRKASSGSPLTISPPNQEQLPVAGGCKMPETKNAANPFFGNIRQNMDLLDGVGQMSIKKPPDMTVSEEKSLPTWLRQATSSSDEGKEVSNKFLRIEKSEQKRMQLALSGNVSYGTTPSSKEASKNHIQVAGIEKGSKNRYNNIFPYEHSRVRLQNVPSHGCDYFNANYVKARYSNRKYIATQAPIPGTFDDFWRVVWEQDVRVIVMLTAESEGGQIKGHRYWNTGEYGKIKVKQLAEKRISLDSKKELSKDANRSRPSVGQRRLTTSNATPATEKRLEDVVQSPVDREEPVVVVRQFTISHSSHPFQPMRDITQLHYSQWPDLGAPASPKSLLGLIELVNKYQRSTTSTSQKYRTTEAAPEGSKPIVVHCSAGCGRTGTFCTVDSVIDMMKRQRIERIEQHDQDHMDVDVEDDWVERDDIDLVAKAVDDFRHQRLSMVQNLRQFVLCYESVLQWLHEDATSARDMRRSYQG